VADNRQYPRKSVELRIAFQIGDGPREDARCRDLSLGGAFLETAKKLPYETKLKVFIQFPGQKSETEIESTVRWSTADGMGVQFGVMGARETTALTELLGSA
jgi:hypothetical protein